jgi:hypothetical protein
MWIVWKRDTLGDSARSVEQVCSTEREARRVAEHENKWRGVYGFKFTVGRFIREVA